MIIPFLVKILFSSRLRSIQKRRSETERDSVVSWAQKPFCVPPNLFVGNRLETPGPSLSSKGQIEQLLIREVRGCRDREEESRNNSAALWQDPGFASRDTLKSIFGRFTNLKPPQNRRFSCSSFQRSSSRDHLRPD